MFRRRWFWLALLLCAAALFVLFRVQRVGESALRAEAESALAESLDAEVRLGPLTLSVGADLPWVGLEFQGARVQWPEVILEARKIAAEVDPIALALGRLSMHGLRIEDLDVEWQETSTPTAKASGPGEALAQTREASDWLSEHPCFLPDTEIRGAVLAQRHAGERREWLREISGEYDCRSLRGRAEARLRGQLPGIPERLEFDLDTRQDHFELTLDFPALSLARLGGLVDFGRHLQGSLAGRLRLRENGQHGLVMSVDASGDALRGGHDAAKRPDLAVPTLQAEIEWEPDTLHVVSAKLRDGTRSFSADARIHGLQALANLDPQRCVEPRKVPAMPGISGLQRWLADSPEEPDGHTSPSGSLDVQLDFLSHPVLFCTLDDLRAQLRWAEASLDLDLAHARVAGLQLQARLSRTVGGAPQIGPHWGLEVRVETPLGAPKIPVAQPAALQEGSWTRGRITLSATSLGRLDIEGASAHIEARRSSLRLSEIALQLHEQDALHGNLQLNLGEALPRFRGRLSAKGLPAEVLGKAFGASAEFLEGETNATLEIRGSLEPGRDLIAGTSGHLDIQVRSGSLRARLPLLLALSAASSTSHPLRDRDRLAFETLDLAGSIADSRLTLEHFKLTGPALSAVSTGHVDLAAPYPVDLEVALFFLQRASSLLKKVPVVGDLLLGKNANLMGAVFAVDGKLGAPEVRLVPGRTFSESLPGALLRGIPTQLLAGARRIGSLAGGASTAPPDATP